MHNRLKRNVFFKATEAIVTIAASFIQLGVIARAYMPSTVGEYQLTLAWLFFASALSCFGGIVMISTRELSQSGDNERSSIFSSAFLLQLLVGSAVCVIALIFFNVYLPQLSTPLSVGAALTLVAIIFQLSQALLISRELISKVVIASVIGHVVATAAICVAAYHGSSVTVLIGAWATYNLTQGIILFISSRAWGNISLPSVRIELVKKLISEIMPVMVMIFASHLYIRIDVVMLSYFSDKTVVARYSAGYLFLDQLMILSNFMIGALFPNFARSAIEGGREFQTLYRGILKLFAKYLVPLALLIALFSKQLLRIIYGTEYMTAWLPLSVLMMAAIFAWINGPSAVILISLKRQRIYMWAALLSLLVNIVGNLILIPIIGAVGAAISTVLTEFAICSFCLYWIYRETGYLPWMRIEASQTAEQEINSENDGTAKPH